MTALTCPYGHAMHKCPSYVELNMAEQLGMRLFRLNENRRLLCRQFRSNGLAANIWALRMLCYGNRKLGTFQLLSDKAKANTVGP